MRIGVSERPRGAGDSEASGTGQVYMPAALGDETFAKAVETGDAVEPLDYECAQQ